MIKKSTGRHCSFCQRAKKKSSVWLRNNRVEFYSSRKHFEEYGEIEEIAFPINKEKKIRKGFCFVTFKDANACELATAKGKEKQDLGGKKVSRKSVCHVDYIDLTLFRVMMRLVLRLNYWFVQVDVKKAVPQEVYQEWNVLYQPYFPNYPPPARGRRFSLKGSLSLSGTGSCQELVFPLENIYIYLGPSKASV